MPPAIDLACHAEPARIAAIAREAEERGCVRGLFVPEGAHDPFISLTLAADATDRLEIGTGIAVAFARTPMSLAYSAHDLHQLSGGRSILGLGSQIKAHITRRFDMPWSEPAARMGEYVAALRAIWHSWQTGDALDFRGDFYSHTLMPPLFSPGQLGFPSPDIWVAGVGPKMVATAGSVADGLMCHPLISRSYLEEVLLPQVSAGRRTGDRAGRPFTVSTMAMVASGATEESLAVAIAGTRKQIGFYASTPAYKPVLDHHGWGALHAEAHALSKGGKWVELGELVDDEVLHAFAVVGEIDAAGPALLERFEGLVDRVTLSLPYQADERLALELASATAS